MAAEIEIRRVTRRLVLAVFVLLCGAALFSSPALAQVGIGSAPTAAPVTQAAAPVTQAAAPVTQAAAPATQAAAPVTQAAAPVTQAAAPATQAAAPVTQAAAPVTQAAAPVTQAAAPATQAAAPVVQQAAPVVQAVVAPVTTTAAPVVQAATTTVVSTVAPVLEAAAPLVETATPLVQQTAAPAVQGVGGLAVGVLERPLDTPTSIEGSTVRLANDRLPGARSTGSPAGNADAAGAPAELGASAPTSDLATLSTDDARTAVSTASQAGDPMRVAAPAPRHTSTPAALPIGKTTSLWSAPTGRAHDASHAPASARPAEPSQTLPRTPGGLLSTLQSAFASAGGGALLILLATMVAAFILAIPNLGRWLRPSADICRPPGFVAQLELPG